MNSIDESIVNTVLADWHTAPIGERLKLTLGLLEQLTLSPQAVGAAEMTALQAAGIGERAIADAMFVCALFCMMDRLADAFDFKIPSYAWARKHSWIPYWFGYKGSSLPG